MRLIVMILILFILVGASNGQPRTFDLGNYTVSIDYFLPVSWIGENQHIKIWESSDQNSSLHNLQWDWNQVSDGEWTQIAIAEFIDPRYNPTLSSNATIVSTLLSYFAGRAVEEITGDKISDETVFVATQKPYPGVIGSGYLKGSSSTFNAYSAPLGNKTILLVISTENENDFARILKALVVTPKEDAPLMRAQNIAEQLNP